MMSKIKKTGLAVFAVVMALLTVFLFVGFISEGLWAAAIQILIPWGMVAGYSLGYIRSYLRTQKELRKRR
jgi:hypothetical protein